MQRTFNKNIKIKQKLIKRLLISFWKIKKDFKIIIMLLIMIMLKNNLIFWMI